MKVQVRIFIIVQVVSENEKNELSIKNLKFIKSLIIFKVNNKKMCKNAKINDLLKIQIVSSVLPPPFAFH